MLFNSLNFLIFFPIAALLYWVLPHKARWVWLLIASYYFYMCWNASYALPVSYTHLDVYKRQGKVYIQKKEMESK